MTKTKISALLLALIVTMSIVGFTYGHWADTIHLSGSVKMGREHVKIIRCKCYKLDWCWCRRRYTKLSCEPSDDRQSITITWQNIWPSAKLWVKMVIKNQGTLPVNITSPIVTIIPDNAKDTFEIYEKCFGPFDGECEDEDPYCKPPPNNWCWCKKCELPQQLDPGQKLVIWWWVHFDTDDCKWQRSCFTITLTLNYHLWNLDNP